MTSITFENALLARASDPENYVTVPVAAVTVTPVRGVTVRNYTSGRRRSTSGPVTMVSVDVQTTAIAQSLADQIEAWVGREVLWRDYSGRRIWGIYDSVPITPIAEHVDLVRVSLTITELTHSEVV